MAVKEDLMPRNMILPFFQPAISEIWVLLPFWLTKDLEDLSESDCSIVVMNYFPSNPRNIV